MPITPSNPFVPDALEANRRGELTEKQRHGFGALSGYQRRNDLSIAAFLVAGAVLVSFANSPTFSPVARTLVQLACLAIAAYLVVRSITGGSALARDLRESRVESVEGAIGKRQFSGGRSPGNYFLDVGNRRFQVARNTYAEAPDAGHVRLYFLPRSRKIVNLEQLANPAVEVTPQGIMASLGAAFLAGGTQDRNEGRAELASIGQALMAGMSRSPLPPPPPEARDPRPLRQAILGAWSRQMMKVTFTSDGRVTSSTFGAERSGLWSVDATGRLQSDLMGESQTVDAWVAGDQLTISTGDGAMTFERESRG